MKQMNTSEREKLYSLGIPKHQVPVWASRTSFIDAIPHLSAILFRTAFVFFLCRWGLIIFLLELTPYYILGGLILWVLAIHDPFFSLRRWQTTWYVVTQTGEDEGSVRGAIYQIQGSHMLDLGHGIDIKSDPITTAWPSQFTHTRAWQSIWNLVTGESMADIMLDDPGHKVSIQGKRLSPEFTKAISYVQGNRNKGPKVDMTDKTVSLMEAIRVSANNGILSQELAQMYHQRLVEDELVAN